MRRILSLLLYLALLLAPQAHAQVAVDQTKTGIAVTGTYTWATKPAATLLPAGTELRISNIGADGTWWFSNGTRYKLVGGRTLLAGQGAITTGVATTETIQCQSLLPAGAWQTNDIVRVWLAVTKSGTTDAVTITFRAGTGGTITDTLVMTTNGVAAANTAAGYIYDFKLTSATTVQRIGNANAAAGSYQGANSTSAPAAATITDASANALYVSVGIKSSGSTDTVGSQSCILELITP